MYPTEKNRVTGNVLPVQEAILYDETTHSKLQKVNRVQLAIPVGNVMMIEPKHRLKSHKEVRQRAKKLKANITVHQMGLSQEISDGTYIVVANPN